MVHHSPGHQSYWVAAGVCKPRTNRNNVLINNNITHAVYVMLEYNTALRLPPSMLFAELLYF